MFGKLKTIREINSECEMSVIPGDPAEQESQSQSHDARTFVPVKTQGLNQEPTKISDE